MTGNEFLRNVSEFTAMRERYIAALNTEPMYVYRLQYVLQAAAAESKEVDCRMRDALS